MIRCWHEDPNLRPTFKQIFEKLTKIEESLFGQNLKQALQLNANEDVHTYKDDELLSSGNQIFDGYWIQVSLSPQGFDGRVRHYKQPEQYEMHYKDDKEIEVIKTYEGENHNL